jgi:hypothetical protein
MLLILYPPGVNWFYEAVARELHDDLATAGVVASLVTPHQFVRAAPGGDVSVLIVNAVECVHSLAGMTRGDSAYKASLAKLCQRLMAYPRRILLNMDGIHTAWFHGQMAQIGDVVTDIFDLCIVPQTRLSVLHGLPYTWIPESFSARGRQELLPPATDRPIPWAVIGHATLERAEIAEGLMKVFGPSGLVFLPELRPFGRDGARNLSQQALARVLSRTEYYVWVSHHRAPYHEGLRALHAVAGGAIPAKIDPLFPSHFQDIPWVYESLQAFAAAVALDGPTALYERARDFLLSRDTFGSYVAGSLCGPYGRSIARNDSASSSLAPHVAPIAWPEREPLATNNTK